MRSDKKTKRKKKLIGFLLKLLATLVVIVAVFLGGLTFMEYKPQDVEILTVTGTSSARPNIGDTIKIISWNIGYGALGDNASYFLDGGKDVITSDEARVHENMAKISAYLTEQRPDVMLLQEMDHPSKRSYNIHQPQFLFRSLEGSYTATYAINHKAIFIPYPIPPLGKVESGLLTVSVYDTNYATRTSLPCPFSWPMRIINLKRCLMMNRTPVAGGEKSIIFINFHLEPYTDKEGHDAQMNALLKLMEEEYAKGNYVIAGGDFNHTFSSVDLNKYPLDPKKWNPEIVDPSIVGDNFTVLMDDSVPSCRLLDQPYENADPNTFQYYVLDGFIISKNLKVQSIKTDQLNFVNSDHNPVILEVTLGK